MSPFRRPVSRSRALALRALSRRSARPPGAEEGRLGFFARAWGGVFADVCVDATARTAFQKGFEVSVVSDGTIGLERPTADALAFMKRCYGARVATASEIAAGWGPARESRGESAEPALRSEASPQAR